MLNNRFAGNALRHIKTFCDAGLEINGQVVLCKGFNDGAELDRTMSDIEQYLPHFQSMSIVPVGLTKFREGLQHLDPFTKEDAAKVLDQIEAKQQYYLKKYGTRIIFASDEWYLRAERPIPEMEEYEGFPQIENGVGMLRSMIDEVEEEILTIKDIISGNNYDVDVCYVNEDSDFDDENYEDDLYERKIDQSHLSNNEFLTDTVFHVITGYAAYSAIKMLCDRLAEEFGLKHIHVHRIINDFFGHDIDVTGLLTGQDILAQMQKYFEEEEKNTDNEEKGLDSMILLPCATLKSGEDIFLDDMPLKKLEKTLQKKIRIVKSSGAAFVGSFMKDYERDYYSNELNKYEIETITSQT
jgi:NifB/MoaA-like Fe-S oxidoreductase